MLNPGLDLEPGGDREGSRRNEGRDTSSFHLKHFTHSGSFLKESAVWVLLRGGCTCTHLGEPVGMLEYEHVCLRRATLKPGRDLLVAKRESALSKETTSTWLCQVGQEKALISQLPSATAKSSYLFVFRLVSRQPGSELRGSARWDRRPRVGERVSWLQQNGTASLTLGSREKALSQLEGATVGSRREALRVVVETREKPTSLRGACLAF